MINILKLVYSYLINISLLNYHIISIDKTVMKINLLYFILLSQLNAYAIIIDAMTQLNMII